jgi:hypothetical protein
VAFAASESTYLIVAGGYFGAQLARTGEDVTFIARAQRLAAMAAASHLFSPRTPTSAQ